MLFETIQKENVKAMKERNKVHKDIFSIVLGKCKNKIVELRVEGRDLNDDDVLAIIQKTVKELDEEILGYEKAAGNYSDKINDLNEQKNVLKSFLPTMLTEEEIKSIISSLDDKSLPNIMKHFKLNYNNRCDMGLVNKIARSL